MERDAGPVTFETECPGIVAGVHLTAEVGREDRGVSRNTALEAGGWLVSKKIKLEIDVAIDERRPARDRLTPATTYRAWSTPESALADQHDDLIVVPRFQPPVSAKLRRGDRAARPGDRPILRSPTRR